VAGGDVVLQGFSWTPEGTHLIVSSAKNSTMNYPPTYNLWAIPNDGSAPSQLTFGEFSYEAPDVGPKGELAASRVRSQSNVWKFPVTGDPAENARRGVRVTHQTGQVQTLTISPDESEVAFLSDNGGHANVWIARVADGEMRALTRESDSRFVIAVPYWSPRGDLIHFLSDRNSPTADVTLWVAKPDGSDMRDLGVQGAWACWSGDGQWLYFSKMEKSVSKIWKVRTEGGQPVLVRDDHAGGCAPSRDGSVLYYLKILDQSGGTWDFEVRAASPEGGSSKALGRIAGGRIPTGAINAQIYLSPDEKWLATPLVDGSTTNLWALPVTGGEWRKLTDFGSRNVVIARRIGWSRDSRSLYASVADVDADIVLFSGLKW
jgi:Tol biopolymer transport system component